MDSFPDKIERMRRIFRGQETYQPDPGVDPGTPSHQATRYRLDHMLEETLRRAKAKGMHGPVDCLISLSGFSPATTILAAELLEPRRLHIIFSQQSGDSIDVIGKYLIPKGKLRFQDLAWSRCDPSDPLGIYRIVREELERLAPPGHPRPRVLIDITGGKKVMSATAALAAWQLDLPLCYIDSDYDDEMRQPRPGTEHLLLLSNPTALFGVQEMQNALHVFRSGVYEAARARYDELSNRISLPGKARFMRDLSALYRAWCDLDFAALPGCADAVETSLVDQAVGQLTPATVVRLRQQLEFVRTLRPDNRIPILLCFYLLGLHYMEVRRHDFAALLFYRTIEGCLTKHLELKYPGFSCDRPDYTLIRELPPEELLRRYNETASLLGDGHTEATLPTRLGFLNTAALLHALEDNLFRQPANSIRSAADFRHLADLAQTRNKSVLAHGFRSVTADDVKRLQGKALALLRAFWSLHKPDENVDRLCAALQFLRMDS